MRIAEEVRAATGVARATLLMGTEANKAILEQAGLFSDALRAARAADLMACDTIKIADGMDVDHAQRDVQRIRTRQWLAERWDQKTYGLQKAQQININVQDLRMAALRHVEVIDDLSTENGA